MKHKIFSGFDLKSLRFKLWAYFVCFAILLIGIVWIAQVYMLNTSYGTMKSKQVTAYAQEITGRYHPEDPYSIDYVAAVRNIAIESGMDIIFDNRQGDMYMINQNGDIIYSGFSQPIYTYENERKEIRQRLKTDGVFTGYSSRNLESSSEHKILIYGTYLDPADSQEVILYLFAPLYPISSTISILKDQLVIITIFALFLAFAVAAYLSRRVTRHLSGIRKSAERLSQGEYGIDFSGGHYTEFIELGDSLTYTSHELAKSDQLKKDIIANVSHDLRTPLTMIRSYAEMIRDLSGDVPEKRNQHLEVILEETNRLNQLVDDMFTLSKMQAGVTSIEKADFDISAALKETYHSYEILCIQDGYTITMNDPAPFTVNGDEARIKQVISNLINNAVKYCGDDKFIAISCIDEGDSVRIVVEDHGMGIPEDQIDHVWDRYYRVSSNYHRSSKGTGLGLSICKEILEAHDATYGVESEVGKGSMFWFKMKKTILEEIPKGRNI